MRPPSPPILRVRQARAAGPRAQVAGEATGHFGELLQGRLGPRGPVALVTLPCPLMRARARLRVQWGAPLLGGPILSRAAIRVWAPGLGGRLELDCAAPPGVGAGSSTLLGLAALRAAEAARVSARPGPPLTARAAAATLRALEGAVDPLMLPRPGDALWASRRAEILGVAPPGPSMTVVGGIAGPGRRTDPADDDFADVADLWTALRAARRAGDLAALGAIAAESARRNQARRPLPGFDDVAVLGEKLGAAGVAAAHTGSTLALLFAPRAPGLEAAPKALRALGLAGVITFGIGARMG